MIQPHSNTGQDKLKDLFREMRMVEPSSDFSKKLMLRIHQEVVSQKKQLSLRGYLSILSGIIGVILIPAIILYFTGFPWSKESVDFSMFQAPNVFESLTINPLIVGCAGSVLLLLVADILIRKHLFLKNTKHKEAFH